MPQTDELQVTFKVVGFGVPPEEITGELGLEPSRSWRKGDLCGDRGIACTHDRWELASPLGGDAKFEAKLVALLDLLETNAEGVRALCERLDGEISVVGYFHETFSPGFHVSDTVLSRLVDLGVSLDLDLYFLGEEND